MVYVGSLFGGSLYGVESDRFYWLMKQLFMVINYVY